MKKLKKDPSEEKVKSNQKASRTGSQEGKKKIKRLPIINFLSLYSIFSPTKRGISTIEINTDELGVLTNHQSENLYAHSNNTHSLALDSEKTIPEKNLAIQINDSIN